MRGVIGKRGRAILFSKRWNESASAKNADKPAKPKSKPQKNLPLPKPNELFILKARTLRSVFVGEKRLCSFQPAYFLRKSSNATNSFMKLEERLALPAENLMALEATMFRGGKQRGDNKEEQAGRLASSVYGSKSGRGWIDNIEV